MTDTFVAATAERIELIKWPIKMINNLFMFTLLRSQYPAVAHILTHSVNLSFGPKSGFKMTLVYFTTLVKPIANQEIM